MGVNEYHDKKRENAKQQYEPLPDWYKNNVPDNWRLWRQIYSEYVSGELSLNELGRKYPIPTGNRSRQQIWSIIKLVHTDFNRAKQARGER